MNKSMQFIRHPDYVNKRDLVGRLATSEPDRGLEVARKITEPWYRCQSLAQVAWHTENRKQFEKIIREALKAAYEQRERSQTGLYPLLPGLFARWFREMIEVFQS